MCVPNVPLDFLKCTLDEFRPTFDQGVESAKHTVEKPARETGGWECVTERSIHIRGTLSPLKILTPESSASALALGKGNAAQRPEES